MADRAIMLVAMDSNGDIVSGAQAYFYERGTLTPLTVYEDEAGETPHVSPVVANSAGIFPPVFVTAGYKIDVQDDVGASLPGYPSDPGYTSPEGATGASSVTFSPITGNAATNVQAAIQNLTTLWNAATTYGRSLIAAADAAAARTVLGLGGLATQDILDEDDFATDSATRPPSQQSVKAYLEGLRFTSTAQTITSGGLLTLPHGLGATPRFVSYRLKCTSADAGYAIGDEVIVDPNGSNSSNNRYSTPRVDATNVYVRLSNDTFAFAAGNKGTGAVAGLTNASWDLFVEASI